MKHTVGRLRPVSTDDVIPSRRRSGGFTPASEFLSHTQEERKMIVPEQITNFNRSQAELEEFALFSILVAGKSAKVAIN